jgi:hypothetical protein|tara:strand:- start:300 stop:590 length:291 start_codon:yes stop_codon:yes gene_type:complete
MLFNQKTLVDNEHLIASPERDLWRSVLTRAVLDAVRGVDRLERDQARNFLTRGGKHFNNVCQFAGRDPEYVQQRMRKILLRKGGWNVDVPITSHYR